MSYIFKINNESSWKVWMNTVHDYERNVLKGKRYPKNRKKIVKQKKERYNFICNDDTPTRMLEFESEKDFVFFMLKWG